MNPKPPAPTILTLHNDVERFNLAISVLDQYHASQTGHYAAARADLLKKREAVVLAIAEAQAKKGAGAGEKAG